MNRLKSIFHTAYFVYLFFSVLMYIFKASLIQQMDADFLDRFLNFWVILGFVFFISVWVIQTIHIGFLKKDIMEHEGKILELKSKLYDISQDSEQDPVEKDTDTSVSHKDL
jgi:hypothetical protein